MRSCWGKAGRTAPSTGGVPLPKPPLPRLSSQWGPFKPSVGIWFESQGLIKVVLLDHLGSWNRVRPAFQCNIFFRSAHKKPGQVRGEVTRRGSGLLASSSYWARSKGAEEPGLIYSWCKLSCFHLNPFEQRQPISVEGQAFNTGPKEFSFERPDWFDATKVLHRAACTSRLQFRVGWKNFIHLQIITSLWSS